MAAPVIRALVIVSLGAATATVAAQPAPPPAYRLAARQAGVPAVVLYAVALQESGALLRRRRVPWPWTLNIAGRAERYASRATACARLQDARRDVSAHRIDVGLGQINLASHPQRYRHPCELLDPYRNLAITATILREQHRGGADWLDAIGRYHRPAGGAPAARYRRRVQQHLAGLRDTDTAPLPTRSNTR